MKPEVPSQGLLFASFLYRSDLYTETQLINFWEEQFGESFRLSPKENPLTSYYAKEMGEPLSRIFFLTHKTFPREFLLTTKLLSLEWETKWAFDGKRSINIDIGFLSPENFLLATTKNYAHRIYLGQNIFADLTYQFHQGELQVFPWTYPDYLDQEKKDFINWARSFLLQIRSN